LVNSQTQPITTPITSDANLQGGVIATPEYIASPSDNITNMAGYTPNAGGVPNMEALFEQSGFGQALKYNSQKLNNNKSWYKATSRISNEIRKGDIFYLDTAHYNHLEVFSGTDGSFRAVVNLDGSINEAKTRAAKGRRIKI
jgi:filamentous hemagglutinin